MKRITVFVFCAFALLSCKNKTEQVPEIPQVISETNYKSFGKTIVPDDAIAAKSMAAHYEKMSTGDSINSKIKAKVNSVCQAKGCWMRLDLENGNEVMVKFKDYGFFVPKDITGKQVIVNGKAFVDEVPAEALRHYAQDAGKTEEEIAKITTPKRTPSFEADGVLLIN
ncbi:DUF4920 domain-containing protein [Tamlana crocina]|uniref:DUF4920 domain-containing protein n=1 Tax=Tamlana crocina TaxID=393006 RepID=A0ABX1DH56_9FLAO|nr:DUF4920 domain-containing protein [Tamlana crocina]NJX16338.1 DUF4920 domain-containing protein [Tamlana crocina]